MSEVQSAVSTLLTSYFKETPRSLKLIDSYMVYVLLTGIIQFVYVCIAGTFPNNAFLAGFISTVAAFVLAANLRIQTNPKNASQFPTTTPESYLQYAQIAARAVRNSLKEDARAVAVRRDEQGLKFAKWEAGKQGELKNTVGNRTTA
ncbi:Dolichyl-diphosphooligosaccharide-protein glycosyltransferase subunit dad1 [Haplosporangium sp. Z 27]|nr:Dolichyl-diphosphooligosaccharide-protein glycosyltransferase subunit dad1 [Haplosporangium sp. Z 27]